MANLLYVIDTTTGKARALESPWSETEYTATLNQVNFGSSLPITASNRLDVWANGRKMREGGANDFTRDVLNGRIVFNTGTQANTVVEIRIYNF